MANEAKKQAAAATATEATPETANVSAAPSVHTSAHTATRPKRVREMVEVTNDLPPVWEPSEPGEMLAGYWDGIKQLRKGKATFNTLRIKGEDGSIHSFSGAIPERTLARMPLGAYVEVTFKGWVQTGGGEARDYRIMHEKGVTLLPEEQVA